ncbi:drug resistance transporter, EmrB/QacA subfamily [Paenibacillus sophorae]|uniref:Drug resistance transporter, EmrB/QacA subfamily n=1 Tax=Paenibacillus sophorae TaxID=1333845 RepID=A0A1H8PIV2_9BACL|nr:MDR family MFS transporter [Paenibacillus sophorae]QWU16588.1 MFS transporter [Paenibacillus sophorae]SEO41736.1 drug resistance transporter, EmrB/QacA subfamily [Paenibacillus sophorae]
MHSKESNLKLVVAGLLLGVLMSAMDNTIVAAALGTIVSDLGGMDKLVWVTSAYMVMVMAGTPVFGKLSDMYGRKRFFMLGLLLFLVGSALCGTAGSITQLSIYRAIQGVGGGALMPIAFTIIFDIFPPEKRGKMTGLFGAVFGISSVLGPLLGAYITDYVGWRWIFYINLPLGVIAFIMIALAYKESVAHSKQRIDWGGAFTLVGAIICLMFALELGGQEYAWGSSAILGLFAGFAVLLITFLLIERRAAEPVITFSMFRNRLFATSALAALFYGSAFIVATVYIPIFVQGVFGGSATNSGLILMPMMIGSVVGAQLGGQLTARASFRNIMLLSTVFFVAGVALLGTLSPDTTRLQVNLFMAVTGFGVGFSFSVLNMSSVHHFDVRQRGSATSTCTFMRSLGMTLGITIFGITQRNLFTDKLSATFGGSAQSSAFGDPRAALTPEARAQIPAPVLEKISAALSSSIAHTFLWALIPAVLGLAAVLLMPKDRLFTRSKAPQPATSKD